MDKQHSTSEGSRAAPHLAVAVFWLFYGVTIGFLLGWLFWG